MGKVIELQQKKARYWNPRIYDAYPQTGDETIDGHPILMGLEQIVDGLLNSDANVMEWLGRPIHNIAPVLPELNPETHALCACCGKEKTLDRFGYHPKKRNERRSYCKQCETELNLERYYAKKAQRYAQRNIGKRAA